MCFNELGPARKPVVPLLVTCHRPPTSLHLIVYMHEHTAISPSTETGERITLIISLRCNVLLGNLGPWAFMWMHPNMQQQVRAVLGVTPQGNFYLMETFLFHALFFQIKYYKSSLLKDFLCAIMCFRGMDVMLLKPRLR